jgi:hypothetical protein
MSTDTKLPPHHGTEPAASRRGVSGTTFVVVCAALAVAFVLFLVFASPSLLDRTLASAPPPAPQAVGSGQSTTWSATAFDASAGPPQIDERGAEAIVEPEPCLRIEAAGELIAETCVARRGGSLRAVGGAMVGTDGTAVVHGIVAPAVSSVELIPASGAPLRVTPTYVDFGFPLGFFTVELEPHTEVTAVRVLDADGVSRGQAECATRPLPLGECAISETDR